MEATEKCAFRTKTKGFNKQILCNLFCKTVDTLDHLIQFNLDRSIIKRKQHVEKSLSIIGSYLVILNKITTFMGYLYYFSLKH